MDRGMRERSHIPRLRQRESGVQWYGGPMVQNYIQRRVRKSPGFWGEKNVQSDG